MKSLRIQFRSICTSVRLQIKPSELYDQRVNDGQLINDEHQRKIVKQLDGVYLSLADYSPPSQSTIMKLFGGRTPPNGLYMHGSVGCGKTMLMDLFFSCCEVSVICTYFFSDDHIEMYAFNITTGVLVYNTILTTHLTSSYA